jgi:L-amino acid N-acyltransferase YncA
VFVAEDQSGVFGFAGFGPERTKRHNYDGELYAIYLRKEKQKMGAGKALVREGIMYLKENGYSHMLVWVLDENPSKQFYLSLQPEKVTESSFVIAEKTHIEIAYGWRNLDILEKKLNK